MILKITLILTGLCLFGLIMSLVCNYFDNRSDEHMYHSMSLINTEYVEKEIGSNEDENSEI